MADTALKDGNDVSSLIAASSTDGTTPVKVYANPSTHRLLVSITGGGVTELAMTGAVNGINASFTIASEPSYVVSDGLWYKALDNNSVVQWSYLAGTITMTIPPTSSIFGIQ